MSRAAWTARVRLKRPLQVAAFVLPWSLVAATLAQPTEVELGEVRVRASPDPNMIVEAQTTSQSSISAQEIAEQQVSNIKDLVRYEPGVSVTNNPSRFGLAGLNIRGLDDNHILMSIDGVRLPDSFQIGGYFNTGRNMVEVGLLRGVDIVRGTGSSVHGVDAMGGAAAFRTLRPEDLLGQRPLAASVELQHASANQLKSALFGAAAGNESLQALVKAVVRRGHETQTQGSVGGIGNLRTVANPQSLGSDALLVHLSLTPQARQRTDLTLEHFERTLKTHDLSQIKTSSEQDLHTHDTYRRQRISLDHRIRGLPVGVMNLKLYRQESEVRQRAHTLLKLGEYIDGLGYIDNTLVDASGSLMDPDRHQHRLSVFQQDIQGLRLDMHSRFAAAGQHSLRWGGEYSQTHTEQLRDGHAQSLSGLSVRYISPLPYPSRDFPNSNTHRASVFAQDDWALNEAWSLVLGARQEFYRLQVRPDATFAQNPFGADAAGVSMRKLVPKFGSIWRFGEGFSLAGSVAMGFRPPPHDEVNMAFANPNQGVVYAPNPNLRAETARQFELSLRHADASGEWAVTAFDNRYRHFLDSQYTNLVGQCPGGSPHCQAKPPNHWESSDPINNPQWQDRVTYYPGFYQTINLNRVRIHGVEAKFSRELAPGWRLRAAVQHTRGRNQDNASAICRVNPPSAVLGLSHERGAWRTETVVSGAWAKKRADTKQVDGATGEATWGCNRQFLPRGHHSVDLFVHWQYNKAGRVSLGIHNLLDATYHPWADVPVQDPHIADSSVGKDRYSQPGRNIVLNVSQGF